MIRSRDFSIDTVCGILILYVIIGHCCGMANTYEVFETWTLFFAFFMPWFFFKSGMFYHANSNQVEYKKMFRRLIVPFFIFSLIGTPINIIRMAVHGDLDFIQIVKSIFGVFFLGSFPGNLPLWFLLSLFIVKLLFNYIYTKTIMRSIKITIIFCVSCIFLLYNVLSSVNGGVRLPYYISNISSGLAFFSLGYLLRNFRPNLPFTLFLLFVYCLLITLCPVSVDMRTGGCGVGTLYMWIPMSLIGIITINNITRFIVKRENIFSIIGKDSMAYYCIHWIVINILRAIFPAYTTANWQFCFILIIGNLILLPIAVHLVKNSRFKTLV
jgi:fucose 4-O-acetylase-like acetyltransferase